jgi:hypothetical protein
LKLDLIAECAPHLRQTRFGEERPDAKHVRKMDDLDGEHVWKPRDHILGNGNPAKHRNDGLPPH